MRCMRSVVWLCLVLAACGGEGGGAPQRDSGGQDSAMSSACGRDCDDGIRCTIDRCDEATGSCVSRAPDVDNDGHGDVNCLDDNNDPLGDDCDDSNGRRFPTNPEVCTPGNANAVLDEDCDLTTFGGRDVDDDGFEDGRCCNPDSVGTLTCGDDCDDGNADAHPVATEVCDGADNDCDDVSDEGLTCGGGCTPACNANADCVGSTTCTCRNGYIGGGVGATGCVDLNECSNDIDGCDTAPDACVNTDGSFSCACPLGYMGGGVGPDGCQDIDECAIDNGGCGANGTCINRTGSVQCACNLGYAGVACGDIDECADGIDNCDANADCINTSGSFTCVCHSGYAGDGVGCVDIDECGEGTATCGSGERCVNTPGSFACACRAGYTGFVPNCVDVEECAGPLVPTAINVVPSQADGGTQANANVLGVSGAWVRAGGNFGLGTWNDHADLCGSVQTTRDAVFRISLSATTALALGADGADKLVMAVFPVSAPSLTLTERAYDVSGTQVPCVGNATSLTQSATLAAGDYYVVIKAYAACTSGCIFMPNEGQDGAFNLEVRDTALVLYPCDTSPAAICTNTPGAFTCACPGGYSGTGLGSNGCVDINECLTNNGGCSTNPLVSCTNTAGSRTCGVCNVSCPDGSTCANSVCSCPGGGSVCGNACVDLRTDRQNCGECGALCPSNGPGTCTDNAGDGNFACRCANNNQIACGNTCHNLLNGTAQPTAPSYCGACGVTCASPTTCVAGACTCPNSGESYCGSSCSDVLTDENNCGSCGSVCPLNSTCTNGECSCPTGGQRYCSTGSGYACIPVTNDEFNCGACGNQCVGASSCQGTSCVCANSALTYCPGVGCVNTATNAANCGACGTVCTCQAFLCGGQGMCVNSVCQ